jgi:hypothetical protein
MRAARERASSYLGKQSSNYFSNFRVKTLRYNGVAPRIGLVAAAEGEVRFAQAGARVQRPLQLGRRPLPGADTAAAKNLNSSQCVFSYLSAFKMIF